MDEGAELVGDRHSWLLERLSEDRRVMTNDAAQRLGVSVDTVRRDLRTLHDRGLLRRVHGGALPLAGLPESFAGRAAAGAEVQTVLAQAVVDRFRPGQVIGLDAGSTNVAVAALIPQTLAVTVVSNNPALAGVLADHRSVELLLLGGSVDLTWMATVGPEAVDGWRNYRLDVAVLGVCGFDPTVGCTTNSQREVATKRAMMAAAAETVLPVQSEKVGIAAPFVVAEADAVDVLVLEHGIDEPMVARCQQAVIDVVQV